MKKFLFSLPFLAVLMACTPANNQVEMNQLVTSDQPDQVIDEASMPTYESGEIATFAGGCFWCMEPAFEPLEGTLNVVVGYAGGTQETANYREVTSETTQHREAVQINYDPAQVSYKELVETLFAQIDPTDNGGQFTDRGFHYTTAIYYHSQEQKEVAEQFIAELEASEKFEDPIVTAVEPFTTFFLAEEYHQDFYLKSAEHYERYAKGSGRKDFIEENWAKEAALENSR